MPEPPTLTDMGPVTFKVTKTQREIQEFAIEVFANFPDFACYGHITCTKWNYNDNEFTFCELVDEYDMTSKEHEVGIHDMVRGAILFIQFSLDKGRSLEDVMDPCNFDAEDADILLQLLLLGDIIYG